MRVTVSSLALFSSALLSSVLLSAGVASAQQSPPPSDLPDAPSQTLLAVNASAPLNSSEPDSSDPLDPSGFTFYPAGYQPQQQDAAQAAKQSDPPSKKYNPLIGADTDANGNPIPLERRQPKRILGILPNYRTVSAGAAVHAPGWKYNFQVATRQAFDPSSFLFLGLTSSPPKA